MDNTFVMMAAETLLVAAAMFVTAIMILLTTTGYRVGIVWKADHEAKKLSIPIAWFTLLVLVGWFFYYS